MVNRKPVSVQSKPSANNSASMLSSTGNVAKDDRVRSAKTALKRAKSGPGNGKMVTVDSPSEAISGEAFGLRRVSFLLPEELAKEFDERGGAAWLAMVLRSADNDQKAPIAAAVLVPTERASESGHRLEAFPALKPDDQVRCGRRRAGMR